MSALRRTGEQPVLSANDEWSYGVFSAVVMRLNVRILQKSVKIFFLVAGVLYCFLQSRSSGGVKSVKPSFKIL